MSVRETQLSDLLADMERICPGAGNPVMLARWLRLAAFYLERHADRQRDTA